MSAETPAQIVCTYVLMKAADEAPSRRGRLYRALAAVVGNEADATSLLALADDCDAIERKHQQLVLNFKGRAN
jgi:hypothetical protein